MLVADCGFDCERARVAAATVVVGLFMVACMVRSGEVEDEVRWDEIN